MMTYAEQLTVPGTHKKRGGARPGAGRKKTEPDTTSVRVCREAVDACKRLDASYRQRLKEPNSGEWEMVDADVDQFLSAAGSNLSDRQLERFAARLLEIISAA